MNPFASFLTIYPGVAVTALIVPLLALRWFLAPAARKQTEWLFVAALLIEPAGILSQLTANSLSQLRPLKLDLFIYKFDAVFGSPSFHLGQLAAAHSWLRILVSVSYGLLPMAMLGAFAATLLLRPEREAVRVAQTFLLNLFAALPIYLLFPVCGPAFAFPSFPALPPRRPCSASSSHLRRAEWNPFRSHVERSAGFVVPSPLELGPRPRRRLRRADRPRHTRQRPALPFRSALRSALHRRGGLGRG